MAKSILIIDDDEPVRTMLKAIFKDLSFTVFEAPDGKKGVEAFRKNPVDIVITDIFMPDKDGLETITELKKDYPDIKIIAMSGNDKFPSDYLKIAKFLGAWHCLRKPFPLDEIISIVNLALADTEKSPSSVR